MAAFDAQRNENADSWQMEPAKSETEGHRESAREGRGGRAGGQ